MDRSSNQQSLRSDRVCSCRALWLKGVEVNGRKGMKLAPSALALRLAAVCSHSEMPRMIRPLFFLTVLTVTATTASAQWQLQDTHTTADLRGIDNVGNGVAWASGSNGTILRTEDAGFVWQLCAEPPNGEHLDFRAIQAFDNNTAIIMSSGKGDLSRLYKTTDGCQTWTLLFTNPDKDGFWDAFWMNGGEGMLIGDPVDDRFTVFETKDGGATWHKDESRSLRLRGLSLGAFAASN